MTNEEVKEIIDRAEDEYDRLKDRVHDLYDENHKLKEIIKEAREYINKNGIIDLNGYDLLEILDKESK